MKMLQTWTKECRLLWLLPWRPQSVLGIYPKLTGVSMTITNPDFQFSHENLLKFPTLLAHVEVMFISKCLQTKEVTVAQ